MLGKRVEIKRERGRSMRRSRNFYARFFFFLLFFFFFFLREFKTRAEHRQASSLLRGMFDALQLRIN
jgi:hypothetical protein